MINTSDTEIQNEIRNLTRKFVNIRIAPVVEKDEETETFRPEIISELGELGLTGIPISEAYQGGGMGYSEYIIAIEEIARVSAAYAVSVAVSGLPQIILSNFGTEEQKLKYIPPLATGKAIGAFSLSEASSGSDAASLKTSAVKSGDHYILNGTKLWTTQGDSAETIMVMARVGTGTGSKNISTFIVEKGTPGFTTGKREKKMGMNISHTMELVFDNVKVPINQIVGKEGDGIKISLNALNSGRVTIGACAVGIAKAALTVATDHAKLREQFGKPISSYQGVSFLLADMATQIDAAELLVRRAAQLKDGDKKYSTEAAMAKLFATDMAMKVTTDAVQVLGGSGYTREFPVERFMREAKVMQIVEGTNQIQRMIIGQSLTGIRTV